MKVSMGKSKPKRSIDAGITLNLLYSEVFGANMPRADIALKRLRALGLDLGETERNMRFSVGLIAQGKQALAERGGELGPVRQREPLESMGRGNSGSGTGREFDATAVSTLEAVIVAKFAEINERLNGFDVALNALLKRPQVDASEIMKMLGIIDSDLQKLALNIAKRIVIKR